MPNRPLPGGWMLRRSDKKQQQQHSKNQMWLRETSKYTVHAHTLYIVCIHVAYFICWDVP